MEVGTDVALEVQLELTGWEYQPYKSMQCCGEPVIWNITDDEIICLCQQDLVPWQWDAQHSQLEEFLKWRTA